jgi:hypothetical protein
VAPAPGGKARTPLAGDLGAEGPAAGAVEAADVWIGSTERAGEVVELVARVNRRAGAPILTRLARPLREAADAYARAFEVVSAGGAATGEVAGDKVSAGVNREGRQFGALGWASRLAELDAAIGSGAIALDARGTSIPTRRLVVLVVVAGLSIPRVLASMGMKRSAPRERAMIRGLVAALDRMADAAGIAKTDAAGNYR